MAIGWINKSTRPEGRTTFGENNVAVTSKADKRYGKQGSKTDFPYSSTGEAPARLETRDLPPSAPSHSHTDRSAPHQATEGWATDGSHRWIGPQHPNTSMHGLDGHHDPAKSTDGAQGQAWSASAGQFGKQSIPASKKPERPSYDHGAQPSRRADKGALAGDSGPRPSYSGGKGPIRP